MNRAAMPTPYADPSRLGARASETALNPLAERGELELVGHSAAIKRLRVQVQRIAPHFRSVLVRGERGSGKELVARMLHSARGVAGEPFLLRDAAAVEGWLRAGDRFGGFAEGTQQRNAVSRWRRPTLSARAGLAVADAGLGGFSSVFETESARNRDEGDCLDDGRSANSGLPRGGFDRSSTRGSLRSRSPCRRCGRGWRIFLNWRNIFCDRFGRLQGRNVPEIEPEAMLRLQEHHWPGNIRELSGVIRDAVLRSDGVVAAGRGLDSVGTATGGGLRG